MTRNQGSNFSSNITSFLSLPFGIKYPKSYSLSSREVEDALDDNKDMAYNPEEEVHEGKH
jgi:hypothetical protein